MRILTAQQLKEILDKHIKYLKGEVGGERANLSFANLSFANLSFANLSFADLSFANLSSANLSFADLRSANLVVFQYQRANAYFTNIDGMLRIGCHFKHISEWRQNYTEIGKKEGYSDLEIAVYGSFIKVCNKLHKTKKATK